MKELYSFVLKRESLKVVYLSWFRLRIQRGKHQRKEHNV